MKNNNWEYCDKSAKNVKALCKRRNYDIKGCVGKSIVNVKCQVMKNLQSTPRYMGMMVHTSVKKGVMMMPMLMESM